MPKIGYELKDFSAGTITNGDYADIPDGAASYSLNVSPTSKIGAAQTINNNKEVMANIPAITSMVVRDGIDVSHVNLAVNIDSLFILIPSYQQDDKLQEFVDIASEGELLSASLQNPANWHSWTIYKWVVIDTVPGYGYEVTGGAETSTALSSESLVTGYSAGLEANGTYVADSNTNIWSTGTELGGSYGFKNNKTFKHLFYATSTKSVIVLKDGTGGTTTWKEPMGVQFAKGGYIWGDLGQNLDLTETERGLFIGSATSAPHLQHKQADKDGDVWEYLRESECLPPTSQNSLSNIDQMVWVYDSTATAYKLMVMIYGESKLFQLVQNTTSGSVDYYEFTGSSAYDGTLTGFGGISESASSDTLIAWDFEGFNIYRLSVPTSSTTTQDWAITTDGTYSVSLQDVPDNGWIADVAEGKADTDKLYILFTRAGGLQEGDTVVGVIDTATGGVKSVTPVYVLPPYKHLTAYTSYGYKKNWLGIKTDVNPSGSLDFYWTNDSSAQPLPYENGDYADITHYTKYGYQHDVCWINTDKDKVMCDIGEGGLAVTTQCGSDHDCIWFNIKPLGATKYLEYSGAWRLAKQWPNCWPDSDPDGWWTEKVESQNIVEGPYLVGVIPQDIAQTDGSLKAFDMLEVPATGPQIAEKWTDVYDKMLILEQHPTWPVSGSQSGPTIGGVNSGIRIVDALVKLGNIRNSSNWANCKNKLAAYSQGSTMTDAITALSDELSGSKFNHPYYENDVTYYLLVDPISHSLFSAAWSSGEYLNDFTDLRNKYINFVTALMEVKDYASAKTVSIFDASQIRHIPVDTEFPIQKQFTQLQAYERASDGSSHWVGTLLDQGVMKHADAVVTTSGGTVLSKLKNTVFTFGDLHTTEAGNGIFGTPINDAETNEVIEATEGWSLYRPPSRPIIHFDGAADDGENAEGMMVTCYTGDLIVKNYVYTNLDNVVPVFDSGDIAIGLKPTESGASVAAEPAFALNDTVFYNMSFLYDGYQEGPLMASPVTFGPLSAAQDYIDIEIKIRNNNPRITHVQIYRKFQKAEKWRLVKSIALDTDWTTSNPDLGLPTGSADMKMVSSLDLEAKDYNRPGISYEALTGMPETLRDTMVHYAESEPSGNYLFIANCRHSKLPDASRMIFRSQPGKFSIFNWAQDFLGMPENIHTLKSFNNRLFAFSNKAMYRIDPFNMVMEADFQGMGISDRRAVISMDGIMYIANKNGVYIYAGTKVKKISQTIDDKWAKLYEDYPSVKIMLAIDKKYNSILCLFDNAGSNSVDLAPTEVLSFTPDKRKWDIWELPARIKAQCINEDNELMVCASAANVVGFNEAGNPIDSEDALIDSPFSLYTMHTGEGVKALEWETKELTFGEDNRRKKFKTVKLIGQDITLAGVSIDGIYKDYNNIASVDNSGSSDNAYTSWKIQDDGDFKRVGKNIKIKVKTVVPVQDNDGLEDPKPILRNVGVTYSWKTMK